MTEQNLKIVRVKDLLLPPSDWQTIQDKWLSLCYFKLSLVKMFSCIKNSFTKTARRTTSNKQNQTKPNQTKNLPKIFRGTKSIIFYSTAKPIILFTWCSSLCLIVVFPASIYGYYLLLREGKWEANLKGKLFKLSFLYIKSANEWI